MSHLGLLEDLTREPSENSEHIIAGSFIGALALMVYNLMLTISDEVTYVWSLPRRSLLKWIFMFLRYTALVSQLCHQFQAPIDGEVSVTRNVCVAWYLLDVITMELVLIAVVLILMIRVYLLYNRERKMALTLGSCLAVEIVVMIAVITITAPKVDFDSRCGVSVSLSTMIIFGTGVLANHFLVLAFTVYKGYKFWRDTHGETRLLLVVLRDGILTFLGLLTATSMNVIVFAAVRKSLSIIGSPWIIALRAAE